MDIVLHYIRTRFDIPMVVIFSGVGLFLLLRDIPTLKERNFKKESTIAKALAYLYIFGSIAMFIVAKII